MIKNTWILGLFTSLLLMFSSASYSDEYGMDCEKPTLNAEAGNTTTFNFSCKNTTGVTFGSYQIFPTPVSGATITATACSGTVAPGAECLVQGTFMASAAQVYEVDFDDEYGGERHYGIFCNNPEKGCIETYYIGEYLPSEGGVVFYIDPNGGDTLIVALNDAGTEKWGPNNNVTTSTALYSGATNTANMNTQTGGSPAATACLDYTGGSHTDWYVPALQELSTLYGPDAATVIAVNDTLATLTGIGATQITTSSGVAFYWSSSQFENSVHNAWYVDFSSGVQIFGSKGSTHLVRCVRAF